MDRWRIILLLLVSPAAFLGGFQRSFAQTWMQTSAPTNTWISIACSADATKIIAVPGAKTSTQLYTSTNSGLTWQTNASGIWIAVASSADGSRLVAAAEKYILASTNSGATWFSNYIAGLGSIAGSADGSKWIAAGGSSVYTSTNSGATWISNSLPNWSWNAVASSTNGDKMVVAGFGTYNGPIYTTADSGLTWRLTSAPNLGWGGVAASADGVKLAALASHTALYPGRVYTSTNSGTNWTATSAPDVAWSCIASSADGRTLLAGSRWDATATIKLPLYLSTNSGATWAVTSTPGRNWEAVAAAADGSKLLGVALNGGIHAGRTIPTLRIGRMAGDVVVSWPALASAADFKPEQNFNLGTTNWLAVTNTPILVSNWNQVTLSALTNHAVYRLKYP